MPPTMSLLRSVRAFRGPLSRSSRLGGRFLSTRPVAMHTRAWVWPTVALGLGVAAWMTTSPLVLEAPMDRMVTETKSSMPMHTYLQADETSVNTHGKPLRLVGMGVRTVTFLNMYVYVAGLYVEEDALPTAQAQCKMGEVPLEEQVRAWLEAGVTCAIRVVPVRATDMNHLRDGFVRTINTRAKDARTPENVYQMTDEAEEALAHNLRDFKGLFPRSKISRGQTLDLIVQRDASSMYTLSLQINGKEVGTVKSGPTARQGLPTFTLPSALLLAYFGERPDISAVFRASVQAHLQTTLP